MSAIEPGFADFPQPRDVGPPPRDLFIRMWHATPHDDL